MAVRTSVRVVATGCRRRASSCGRGGPFTGRSGLLRQNRLQPWPRGSWYRSGEISRNREAAVHLDGLRSSWCRRREGRGSRPFAASCSRSAGFTPQGPSCQARQPGFSPNARSVDGESSSEGFSETNHRSASWPFSCWGRFWKRVDARCGAFECAEPGRLQEASGALLR